MTAAGKPVAWLFSDGKPGHENQALGLLEAIASNLPLQIVSIPALSTAELLSSLLGKTPARLGAQPPATFAVGAGHATHLSLLYSRWRLGVPAVVLMKPSLPLRWFDLCLVPRHDRVPAAANVIETLGAVNRIQPMPVGQQKAPGSGVMLVGGPSSHYNWDEPRLLRQINDIIVDQTVQWQLSASRRTPAATVEQLLSLASTTENLTYIDWQAAGKDWLPAALAKTTYCWVSEDSVSMVYEALTAQAKVGLLTVPRKHQGRVAAGIDSLRDAGYLVDFTAWQQQGWPALEHFENQAERCAGLLIDRLGLTGGPSQ